MVVKTVGCERRWRRFRRYRRRFTATRPQDDEQDQYRASQSLLSHEVGRAGPCPHCMILLLELDSRADLNNARIVDLLAKIDQPRCRVWVQVIRVVQEVEEVTRQPQFQFFGKPEVLEERCIRAPRARAEEKVVRIPSQIV